MFRMAREKRKRCKYVEGFGENAFRCENYVDPGMPEGVTHCRDHRDEEARTANRHPAKLNDE